MARNHSENGIELLSLREPSPSTGKINESARDHRSRHHRSRPMCKKVFLTISATLIILTLVCGTLWLLNELNIIPFKKIPKNSTTTITTAESTTSILTPQTSYSTDKSTTFPDHNSTDHFHTSPTVSVITQTTSTPTESTISTTTMTTSTSATTSTTTTPTTTTSTTTTSTTTTSTTTTSTRTSTTTTSTTTTPTTTTSTTSTTTTSTTTTSTTTTSTTTTSTTTTSTTTTSTTTTSTTTTSTTTTSTATTSTTITSTTTTSTTTTSTTTTSTTITSTTTTRTTPAPKSCPPTLPQPTHIENLLLLNNTIYPSNYSHYISYFNTSIGATVALLVLEFRAQYDFSPWYLDDVSIKRTDGSGNELIRNNGFENPMTNFQWMYCYPPTPSTAPYRNKQYPHSGKYCFQSRGQNGQQEYLSQNFTVEGNIGYTMELFTFCHSQSNLFNATISFQ